jgi:hypothetical protein
MMLFRRGNRKKSIHRAPLIWHLQAPDQGSMEYYAAQRPSASQEWLFMGLNLMYWNIYHFTDWIMRLEYLKVSALASSKTVLPNNFFLFSPVLQPRASYGLLVPRGFLITHNDAPQSVGLLWTSDQLVAETSTWQHTTDQHPCPGGIRTHDRSRWAAVDLHLRTRVHWDWRITEWIHYVILLKLNTYRDAINF